MMTLGRSILAALTVIAAASCAVPASADPRAVAGSGGSGGSAATAGATGSGGMAAKGGTGATSVSVGSGGAGGAGGPGGSGGAGGPGGSGGSNGSSTDGGARTDVSVATDGAGGGGAVGGGGTGGASGPTVRGADPTEQTASTKGPYRVMRYSAGLTDSPDYGGYDVDYPADATPPFAGVAVIPGFIEGRSAVGDWGPLLASHGFVVITVDPNLPLDPPAVRAAGLRAAIASLKEEHNRTGSPLAGKVDLTRFAVMGHSMGGGATLEVANMGGMELKAAIPLEPWDVAATFTMITAPTMIMAGENDGVAPIASHAMPFYDSIPTSTAKAYVEFAGGDHYASDRPSSNPTSAVLAISWLKLYVEGDTRYRQFIKMRPALSRFLTGPNTP
jgi:dienelactone hydrolase